MTCGNETIATIVAGTAEHGDFARIRKAQGDLVRHGASGILHKPKAGHPAFHGKAIGLAHLLRGQQLEHRSHDKAKTQRI
jgi:hypothetical protein